MEVIPGVHAIGGLSTGRAYLYQEADRLTLIDTSQASNTARIINEIERTGRKPGDLQQIIITHCHDDHTGSLAELVDRTGAQVLVHTEDAPVVRGEGMPLPPVLPGFERILFAVLVRSMKAAQPARVDRELADGDEIDLDGGARVVHTPGHTPGNIAIFLPKRRLLFTGDAAGGGPTGSPALGVFNADPRVARESFRKLAALDFDVACFGHGRPLDKDASLAFRRTVERFG
ncbi:MAG: MBL fold metallo-hydrolase [Dehalococcoidia bacterium]